MSIAVTIAEPTVLRVTLTVREPADKDPLDGSVALASLEVRPTVWVLLTRFHAASTDRMVTVNEVPAVRAVGVPVLPVKVPGAAVSPGMRICNLVNTSGSTGGRQMMVETTLNNAVRSDELVV